MSEDIIDPDRPIIDPHHHLYAQHSWTAPPRPYLLQDFQQDLEDGHNIISTIYVECSQLFRNTGPEHLRASGEAEFAAVMGRLSDTGHFGSTRVCEGFIGRIDPRDLPRIDEMVEHLMDASDGRLRGIRFPANWNPDPQINPSSRSYAPKGLMADEGFRNGIRRLAGHRLIFDSWQYYPQLAELVAMARAMPDVTIVCCHCGGLIGKGAYSGPENFSSWRANVSLLADIPNIVMKLGGIANERTGFDFFRRESDATEVELVEAWTPYIETCIDLLGPDRCMFESNFPVDMCATSYRRLWNTFKKITIAYSNSEKDQLFSETARRVYSLT